MKWCTNAMLPNPDLNGEMTIVGFLGLDHFEH